MKKLRLYLDSSIFGWSLNQSNPGRFAEANLLLKQIPKENLLALTPGFASRRLNLHRTILPRSSGKKAESAKLKAVAVHIRTQANKLAQTYCERKIVPVDFEADAFHIAMATLWNADALVSYNFQYIVNLEIMVAVNKINKELDLNEIFLCQPQEVIISGC